jgi:hypothetical protein
VEAAANWYWIVDETEQAGLWPLLVHPRKAKLMMGMIDKTDELGARVEPAATQRRAAHGVDSPGPLRESRKLTRTCVVLVAQPAHQFPHCRVVLV